MRGSDAADQESGWTPLHRSLYHQHLSSECVARALYLQCQLVTCVDTLRLVLPVCCLSKASLLLLRHAQTRFGKKFLRKYLHETRDHAQQSPMQLLSTRLHREELRNAAEACEGGLVYTFGKRDYQVLKDFLFCPRCCEMLTAPASVFVTTFSWAIICQMQMYR